MKQEKIAFVVPYGFVPPRNGGHQAAWGFSVFVNKVQPLVAVSTTNIGAQDTPFELKLLFRDVQSKYFNPAVLRNCYRFFKEAKISRCIVHQPLIGLVTLPACRLLDIPFEVFVQNVEYTRFKSIGRWWWPLMYLFEWFILRQSNHLYFISDDDIEPAKKAFGLKDEKISFVPFGTPYTQTPEIDLQSRNDLREKHAYDPDEFLIIFFGPQTYEPNMEAVQLIIEHINPILRDMSDFKYRFLICGGGLPEKYDRFNDIPEVDYLGFVEDIESYVKASDIMINPVNTGGGVKTKLVEALALGKSVISSVTGSRGVDKEACGDKLILVDDYDYRAYAEKIIYLRSVEEQPTPEAFYRIYHWANAVKPVTNRNHQ